MRKIVDNLHLDLHLANVPIGSAPSPTPSKELLLGVAIACTVLRLLHGTATATATARTIYGSGGSMTPTASSSLGAAKWYASESSGTRSEAS